ncbi:MBL fold metallo-hydrolase [Thermogladius sp. 4427co]|uniref:MBL fold metallo-hydrolase n=1 Tax=Thermogladius sp. 4427co TaxID=3450718 RepID=UPI003F7A8418
MYSPPASRIDVLVADVKPGVKVLKLVDRETRFFESLWEIPEGVSYNAYILDYGGGLVLVDTWKTGYGEMLVDTLSRVGVLDRVTHVVLNHFEPDHSGGLKELLEHKPGVRILGHPLVGRMLQDFYGVRADFTPVRDGADVRIGGLVLRFYNTPWLHWPETIVTYSEEHRVLFTCDILGSYGAHKNVFLRELPDGAVREYFSLAKKYFANVIGHYRDFVIKNYEKLKGLIDSVEFTAPGHGLVLDKDYALRLLEEYRKWASTASSNRILVVYASMYGSAKQAAIRIAGELAKAGFETRLYGFTDVERPMLSEIVSEAIDSGGYLFITPVYENTFFPLIKWVIELVVHKAGCRKTIIVDTYGWGGKGVEFANYVKSFGCRDIEIIELKPSEAYSLKGEVVRRVTEFYKG